MRYRLRTLLLVLTLGPMMLAGVWWAWPKRRIPGNVSAAQAQVGLLEDAVQLYCLDVGQLPIALDALFIPPAEAQLWDGPYLMERPIDPWGNSFRYEIINPSTNEFRIWSVGRDGVSGTKDDVQHDW